MDEKLPLVLYLLTLIPGMYSIDIGTCQAKCSGLPPGSKIVQVSMVYRHGDRNPISEYPTSIFFNESNWKRGFGQLTKVGEKQQYNFGIWIKDHYGPNGCGLLPAEYDPRHYKVVSTNLDRTIMSGLANTAGIYPPSYSLVKGLRWKPVPVRNIEENEYDETFGQFCPKMTEMLTKLREERFKELQQKNPELFIYADNYSQYGMSTRPERMFWLYDTAYVEYIQKNWLPDWLKPIFPYPLRSYFYEFLRQYAWTDQLKRLYAGTTLKTIFHTMVNVTLGLDSVKLRAYSAHDTNVFSIMSVLGLEPAEPPLYTSAVIFELYKTTRSLYFVRLLYRTGPGSTPFPLIMPGCGGCEFCRLETIYKVLKPYFPDNFKEECKTDSPDIANLALDKDAFLEKLVRPYVC
ncbi:lysosomal acid phosphatase-like [Ischnura elegans]|uniref:lysosomal acid phosphatase-like n=1 Tax=Ischnura elegans TaxID=197161 RepID=UPI001ED87094|nr:lysosomal acid phosphatase-like [Ischnura elegans]